MTSNCADKLLCFLEARYLNVITCSRLPSYLHMQLNVVGKICNTGATMVFTF